MATVQRATPVHLEYLPSAHYQAKLPAEQDLFRHDSSANSHNHHDRHPWGSGVSTDSREFDSLYAQANNQFMYHLWYRPELAPYMATELIGIFPLAKDTISELVGLLQVVLQSGIDTAIASSTGKKVVSEFQAVLDSAGLKKDDKIFVRLGATSSKDSFALNEPTTKPTPVAPDAETVLRRLLTSGRSAGRLLALHDRIWPEDPGEALVIQRWSETIELSREFRVFCYDGKVTAISQDIWWEPMGWRERYSDGFVEAICSVWEGVKAQLPFSSCTMDVLMTEPKEGKPWHAAVIEFNGFGAHLNTGSDLFHWLNDADILEGRRPGITLRFVDDWEGGDKKAKEIVLSDGKEDEGKNEPDWLALEKKLRDNYAREEARSTGKATSKVPLRGRWSSAY